MPQDSKRRLVAIMFADIVGYTAMMQRNEQEGLAKVHRFSEVVEVEAKANHGEILEFKGDGCLVVFESAVEAMRAAKAIQTKLKESPAVPLRIGIHIGDIVFTKGNIYGDGVNLASRVESMGVPGSILVTERVIHDVKSHPEFEMASLGRYQFKNVEKPMEVFALANEGFTVPRPKEMKGKGKKVSRMPLLFLIPAIIIGIVGIVFILQKTSNSEEEGLLSKDIREGKVAVAIFENFTGDKDLDALGYIASEWITIGLQEIGVKTVTPQMIRQYKDYITVLPNDPQGRPSFAEITQAKYLINGSYLPKGDSIQLITRLTSTETGEEIQNFPLFQAPKTERENLAEEARKRLMGYWAIEKDQYFPKVKPPKYEAYQKYITCWGANINCNLEVLALDSTFILNHAYIMLISVWYDQDSLFNLSEAYISKHWDECTDYEKNFYTFAKEFWDGNYEKAYEALEANYLAEPRNLFTLHELGAFASYHLKRPHQAIPIFQQLFDEYHLFRGKIPPIIFNTYVYALNRVRRFEDMIDFASTLPDNDWFEATGSGTQLQLYYAYLETGQKEKAIAYMEEVLSHGNNISILTDAAEIWSFVFQDTIPNPYHPQIRKRLVEYPAFKTANDFMISFATMGGVSNELKEYQYYLLGDLEEAEKQFLALRGIHRQVHNQRSPIPIPIYGTIEPWIEAMLGLIYARQGKPEKAFVQLEKLEQFRPKLPEIHSPPKKGFISYWQAQIFAVLGDKEAAFQKLQQAIKEGRAIYLEAFYLDRDLANLRGYEPYERLVEGRE